MVAHIANHKAEHGVSAEACDFCGVCDKHDCKYNPAWVGGSGIAWAIQTGGAGGAGWGGAGLGA